MSATRISDGKATVSWTLHDSSSAPVDAVAVDSATDTVYVAKFADDTVSVIDGSKRAVTATVSMGHSSLGHGVAVDPDTHAVYVTSFNDDTVSVIELAQ